MNRKKDIEAIKKYVRAADYLAAIQIYLQDNFLLERKLEPADIKPRLLGHWGTCPGINFVYANLNYLIKKNKQKFLFILGPGHGFPALQANLFLEGTLSHYYPEVTPDEKGIAYFARNFSWPYGFPSHSNPGAPGAIVEGGELGYALASAYGAVLDQPDLIAACLIGDGEAETGPTAAAWHLNKLVNLKDNGAVLPILHLNGYKISGPTIFGRMKDKDLISLFSGYGYEPVIIEGNGDIFGKALPIFESALRRIKALKKAARGRAKPQMARLPMIILKTPKGWTGIKTHGGLKIEGNCLSHQVVAGNAKTDTKDLAAVEKWLSSYKFGELFDRKGGIPGEIRGIIPSDNLRMGECDCAFGGKRAMKDLKLPDIKSFSEDASVPGTVGSSSMRRAGAYLKEVFRLNKKNKNFRFLCPDETYSNKLDAIFEVVSRAFVLPVEKWDKDLSPFGRVMELLSEHSLQGLMQGYVLTGRHAVFASYEAFIQIISSMVDQYAKFLRVAREISWRGDVPSLNYILTSSGWRQEHNGFSHQNPGFIDTVLQKQGCYAHVFFPPDGNSTLAVLKKCLASKNEINVIVAGKTLEPRWLTPELANEELEHGLMVWDFASDNDPDIVVCGIGDYLTKEALAAVSIVKREAPEIKVRFVNVLELSALVGIGGPQCEDHEHSFENYFTPDKPIIFNFHGYPETLKQILFDQKGRERFSVHGYIENGSTTTPYDMQVRNGTSRWHLAIEIFTKMSDKGVLGRKKGSQLVKKYQSKFHEHIAYIKKYGVDMEEIEKWQWKKNS